jgi:hypothetical protein
VKRTSPGGFFASINCRVLPKWTNGIRTIETIQAIHLITHTHSGRILHSVPHPIASYDGLGLIFHGSLQSPPLLPATKSAATSHATPDALLSKSIKGQC